MRAALTLLALAAGAAADFGRMDFLSSGEFKARRAEAMADANARLYKRQTANTTTTTPARYRTDKTEPFLVTSMPEVNFDFGEMYAGMIPLGREAGAGAGASTANVTARAEANSTSTENGSAHEDALFFIFKPKDGEPVDELTIWLNGGPGCSSMEGFLQELGPINWLPGTYAPVPNPYSWSNLTNMLFVDQPVGTGYSTGTPKATSQEDIAADFLVFFRNFQDTFGISNYRIFVTGESYAGRYVPYIANAMLDANDTAHFNLSGILIYDPVIGSAHAQQQFAAYPYIEENNNVWNFNRSTLGGLKEMHERCGYADIFNKYLAFPPPGNQPEVVWDRHNDSNASCDVFGTAIGHQLSINPCFNPYEIVQPCPIPWDVLAFTGFADLVPQGTQVYFDRADLKAALHAPDIKWKQCNPGVFVGGGGEGGSDQNGDLSADSIQSALPRVIEATQRVLVSNGDFDFIIPTFGTLLAIQNMTWGGQLGFQQPPSTPFSVMLPDVQWAYAYADLLTAGVTPPGQMGVQHFERGLMWVQVWGAGHMLPLYSPRAAYLHLAWVLGRIDSF